VLYLEKFSCTGLFNLVIIILVMHKYVISLTLISIVLVSLMLFNTDPSKIGPLGILAVFVLLYVITLSIVSYIIFISSGLFSSIRVHFGLKRIERWNFTKCYLFGSVIAIGPIVILGISSLGSVSFYEIILVLLFLVISCFFVSKKVDQK